MIAAVLIGSLAAAPVASTELLWSASTCPPSFDGCSQVWRANDDGSGARQVLTDAWSARFDATGSRIAFIRKSGVHIANADGSDARPLAPVPESSIEFYDSGPVFSPDGSLVAFDSNRPDGGPCRRVWLVDSAGAGEPWPLPGNACGGRLPRFTPTGTHIIGLQHGAFGTDAPSLVAHPVAGGPAVEILGPGAQIGPFSLAFSPDGRTITFEGRHGLTTLDLVTGQRVVTVQGWEPEWSVAGPALFYSGRTPSGTTAIFRLAAGGTPVQVTPGGRADHSPSWAPIGLDLPPLPVVDTIAPLIASLAGTAPVALPVASLPSAAPRARAAAALPERILASDIASVAAIDLSGVRTVEAAAALESGRRCRQVVLRGVSRRRTACRPTAFVPVSMTALRDRFERLPEGNYRVWLRATDGVGNRTRVRLLRVAV